MILRIYILYIFPPHLAQLQYCEYPIKNSFQNFFSFWYRPLISCDTKLINDYNFYFWFFSYVIFIKINGKYLIAINGWYLNFNLLQNFQFMKWSIFSLQPTEEKLKIMFEERRWNRFILCLLYFCLYCDFSPCFCEMKKKRMGGSKWF